MPPTSELLCAETRSLLAKLPHGELAIEDRDRIERHVATCASCADELAAAERALAALRALPADEQARLRDGALAELGLLDALPSRRARLLRFVFLVLAVAIVYAVLRARRDHAPEPPRGVETR